MLLDARGSRLLWRLLRPQMIRAYNEAEAHGRGTPAEAQSRTRLRLSAAISDAARNVPYYRERWKEVAVLRGAENGDVDLTDLPVLTRADLREHGQALRHVRAGSKGFIERSTGGSTGEPVRFLQSRKYLESSAGRGLRMLTWGGWELGARTALVWGGPNELRLSVGVRELLKSSITNRRTFDAFRTGADVYALWVDEWRRWKPRFLIGYASALAGVADFILASGARVDGIEAVFSTAEKLYPEQRERIGLAFAAPVRDQYGSREVPSVACECTAGHMHVYQDSAFFELLAYDVPGLSQIALTQLDNPIMPLIRYVNGDLGVWSESHSCACGLSYPVLREITGRTSDLFQFADGRVVHGEYFTHVMYNVSDVEAFQFYQAPQGDVTLFVQPRQTAELESLRTELDQVLQRLPGMLGTSFEIAIQFVSEIPRRGQGKHRFTLSEYEG